MKIDKTPSQIKTQMEFWVLKSKTRIELTKHHSMLNSFDLLDSKTKEDILKKTTLSNDELIVFVLKNKPQEYIINTTKRFLKITGQDTEELLYSEFKTIGLNETGTLQNLKLLRVAPKYKNCYLITKNENVIIWEVLYDSINCFIQASKRCELIGRKYQTTKM